MNGSHLQQKRVKTNSAFDFNAGMLFKIAPYQVALVPDLAWNCIKDSSVNFQDLAWHSSHLVGVTDISEA